MKRLAKPALAIVSAAATFLGAEFGVRWHVEGGPLAGLASFAGASSTREVRAPDAAFLSDPELGFRLNPARPGVNALGLPSPPIEIAKLPGTIRAIVLGDSVAWEANGVVDLLRERLQRPGAAPVELVNACVPGYTTYQERRLLERDLLRLDPDFVLLQYCLNDNHRFLHRLDADGNRLMTPEAKRALLPEGDGLWERFGRWSYLAVEIRRRLAASRLRSENAFPWESREDVCTAWKPRTWTAFEEHMLAMRDALRARGASLAVAAFPLGDQIDTPRLNDSREIVLAPQRELARVCARWSVPLLDLFDAFHRARGEGKELFTDGIHLTPAGHSLAAEEIARFLEKEQLPRR